LRNQAIWRSKITAKSAKGKEKRDLCCPGLLSRAGTGDFSRRVWRFVRSGEIFWAAQLFEELAQLFEELAQQFKLLA